MDNEKIALWIIENKVKSINKHVFLTHGTFSNKNICLGMAKYLADFGYSCYIMEWRGHGNNSVKKNKYNFDTIALFDINTTFNFLFSVLKLSAIDCVTHSGGGICLTMCLIKNHQYQKKINSITLFACQAFGAVGNISDYLKILFFKFLCFIIGFVPAKLIGLGPERETFFMMRQWFDWNLKKTFANTNNTLDYRVEMQSIDIPILSIAAENDPIIAPVSGCKSFIDAFNNDRNLFVCVSVEKGYLEDYSHSSLLTSKNARKEIWPMVVEWMRSNSS